MKKIRTRFLVSLVFCVVLVLVLSGRLFITMPVGALLDPFVGFVQNENDELLNSSAMHFDKRSMHDSVEVYFDERRVPHIYARNNEDIYYAQGFVTAALRLWQMDFMSYAAAGRLSEIYGDRSLQFDRNQRRTGLPAAAAASLAMIESDPETVKMIDAYTRGVNAWIQQLNDKSLPLEYKIFGYGPEPWTNLKTVLVMKHMAALLCGYEEDAVMSRMLVALGEEKFNRLFPDFPAHMAAPVNDAVSATDTLYAYLKKPAYLDSVFLSMDSAPGKSPYNPAVGSNSWVVSGKKTKSGYPILCSDPHLSLSLPSIWLEMQLVAPGLNVYGVSVPGIPSVLIGFNEKIAWGTTNGADDTKDWYKLTLDKKNAKYLLDGQWKDLEKTIEKIKIKGGPAVYDTIYHSVHGPVPYDNNFPGLNPAIRDHALTWALHRPSNELRSFLLLGRAQNYTDFKMALRGYASPVLNFTFACADNDIAVHHQGKIAVKWQGQGKFILDGSSSAALYSGYIPEDSLPHVYNPSGQFVIAANQHPAGAGYAYYNNGYYRHTRAKRIRQLLAPNNRWDIAGMQGMQLDNFNVFAQEAKPVFLQAMDTSSFTAAQRTCYQQLGTWSCAYEGDETNAVLFELWRQNIRNFTWDEIRNFSFGNKLPDDYILLDMINRRPADDYFDRVHTPRYKENAAELIRQAFDSAVISYEGMQKMGVRKWSERNRINISSVANISLFSRLNMPSNGFSEAINSISQNLGPSWRMIVELGPRPKAVGIFPAGQSGNGLSRYFDNFVDDWSKGNYYELQFYMTKNEAASRSKAVWSFQ